MNITDIESSIREVQLEIADFTSQYNMEEIRRRRHQYKRLKKRHGGLGNISAADKEILRTANSVCDVLLRKRRS